MVCKALHELPSRPLRTLLSLLLALLALTPSNSTRHVISCFLDLVLPATSD